MTVPIDVAAALIFLTSCAVGYAVHRHTRENSTALPKTGDIGSAFGAALVTMSLLGFLFGVSPDRQEAPPSQQPAVVVSSFPSPGTGGAGSVGTPPALPSTSAPASVNVPPSSPATSVSASVP
jgi:hypothetical protein